LLAQLPDLLGGGGMGRGPPERLMMPALWSCSPTVFK